MRDKLLFAGIITISLFMNVSIQALSFEATPHMNDGYTVMSYSEENIFLAEYPAEDREYIRKLSRKYLVPVKFIYRVNKLESQLDNTAIRYESDGRFSVGMLQIISSNFKHFDIKFNNGNPINYYDKYQNLEVGVAYIRWLYERYDGQWLDTFVCYNFGLGRFDRGDVIPQYTIDYAFSIVYGPDYYECVSTIRGSIEGML